MVLKSSINANKLAYIFLSNTLLLLRLNQDECKPEESVCVGHLKAAFLLWRGVGMAEEEPTLWH